MQTIVTAQLMTVRRTSLWPTVYYAQCNDDDDDDDDIVPAHRWSESVEQLTKISPLC